MMDSEPRHGASAPAARRQAWSTERIRLIAAALAIVCAASVLISACRGAEEATPEQITETATAQPDARPPTETAAPEPVASTATSAPSTTSAAPPVWQIAYVSPGLRDPDDGHEQIYVVNADGSQARNLTNRLGNHLDPTWSPDGRQIAFVSDRDGYLELYVMDADGANVRRLTENDWLEQAPSWSPDGTQLAFDCYLEGFGGQDNSRICAIGADGSNPRVLTTDINGYAPVWSPDGRQLAFTGIPVSGDDIYLIDADGSNLRPLATYPLGADRYPAWSPDGEQLVYVSWRGEGARLHVVNVDGSKDHGLLNSINGLAPAWSPDGRQVAFVSVQDGDIGTIYVIDADGSQLRELAPSQGQSQSLAWSPDGSAIAFVAGGSLHIVNANGAELRTVAAPVAWLSAAWRPTAAADEVPPPEPSATPTAAADLPTLEEVYARAAESLAQEGVVYHEIITIENQTGLDSLRGTIEQWVDVNRNLARSETKAELTRATPPATMFDAVGIIANGERTSRNQGGDFSTTPAPKCYGASEAVAVVLWCPGPTITSTTVVERGEWEGRPAIILVETGTSSGSDERSTFVSRLYLDAESYLPMVRISEGTFESGQVVPLHSRFDYTHEFVPVDSLPADFFDPASIGYSPPDFSEPLDQVGGALTVYWLGERFEPGAGLPALVLKGVYVPPAEIPGYRASLDYQTTGATFGLVMLQEWQRTEWEAGFGAQVEQSLAAQPCAQREELELAIGQAVIYMAWDPETATTPGAFEPEGGCSAASLTSVRAIVFAGDTIITIDAPGKSSIRDGYTPNAFSTYARMLALVEGLLAR